jgi:hypothetical protein
MMKIMFLSLLFITLGTFAVEPILKIDFDGKTAPQGKLKPSKVNIIGAPLKYTPGVSGQAIITQAQPKQGIGLIFKDGLLPDQGSISFWVCPLDWNYLDKKFHIFFNAHYYAPNTPAEKLGKDQASHSRILIYKYANKNIQKSGLALPVFYFQNNKVKWALNLPGSKMTDWKQSKWHFITFVWQKIKNKPYCTYYVDAERVGTISRPFDFSGIAVLTIGASWGNKGKTAIDNFCIFAEPLSREQITEIFETNLETFYSKQAEKGAK